MSSTNDFSKKNLCDFQTLVEIVDALREPETGCPWDLEQDHKSLTRFTIEEAYEYLAAVESEDPHNMKEELGDLLLQVVLNSKIADQEEKFQLADVIEGICKKMISRHPHVFSTPSLNLNSQEVVKQWDEIKAKEKSSTTKPLLDVPYHFSALLRAGKIGKQSKKYHFDWSSPEQVMEKVLEELEELKEVYTDSKKILETEHEIGDLLFSVAQLARHKGIDPEEALQKCNFRFERRFKKLDELRNQKDWSDLTPHELEELWQEAKRQSK